MVRPQARVRRTKLHRPPLPVDYLRRPALLAMLDEGLAAPLTLLTAPAGYGKSSLASGWLQECDHPGAWVALDEGDSAPVRFLRYVVAAVRRLFPDSCATLLELLDASTGSDPRELGALLADELDEIDERFVLVLDDFSALEGPAIPALLEEVLRHPPLSLHLVIVGRRDPGLPIARLRAQGGLKEIRLRSLQFAREEVGVFLALEDEALDRVHERTEGWPASLRMLAALLGTGHDVTGLLERLPQGVIQAQEYLGAVVFDQQPAAVQALLLETSVVRSFNSSLCAALHGAERMPPLDWIGDEGLFMIAMDEQREWFRYHSLFREFLARRLARERTRLEIATLHDRARDWFDREGDLEKAVDHALAGNRPESAVDVGVRHYLEFVNDDRWDDLSRTLLRVPAEHFDLTISGQMLRALTFCPPSELPALLDRLSGRLPEDPLTRGHYELLRAFQHLDSADGPEAVEHAEKALALLPQRARLNRAEGLLLLALGNRLAGRREAGLAAIEQGLREFSARGGASYRVIQLARCQFFLADFDLGAAQDAAESILVSGVGPGTAAMAVHYLAECHYECNELDAAERLLRKPSVGGLGDSQVLLALVLEAKGLANEADEVAAATLERAQVHRRADVAERVRALQAELVFRRGDSRTAARWAREFRALDAREIRHVFEPAIAQVKHLAALDPRHAAELLVPLEELARNTHNRRAQLELRALDAMIGKDRESALQVATEAQALGAVRLLADLGPGFLDLLPRSGDRYATRLRAAALSTARTAPVDNPLTDRELEILEMLAQRLANKEIAGRLFISLATVKRHAANIYAKLGVSGRRAAAAAGRSRGLLP